KRLSIQDVGDDDIDPGRDKVASQAGGVDRAEPPLPSPLRTIPRSGCTCATSWRTSSTSMKAHLVRVPARRRPKVLLPAAGGPDSTRTRIRMQLPASERTRCRQNSKTPRSGDRFGAFLLVS